MGESAKEKQSFGEQAARFSIYVPIAAILIGCLSRGPGERTDKDIATVATILMWMNFTLVVAGFVLGIVALVSMKKFGRKRILGRAIVGVILNGAVLAAIALAVLPVLAMNRVHDRLTGRWKLQPNDPTVQQAQVEFDKNGTFRLTGTKTGVGDLTLDGKWVLTPALLIGVDIQQINGNANPAVKKMAFGKVTSVDASRMVLSTDNGVETYTRVP